MKKLIMMSAMLLGIGTSVFAQQKNADEIIKDLNSYDVTKDEIPESDPAARSWWQSVLNVCTVVVADAAGAYGGVQGTIGLAGAVGLATGGTGVAVVAGVAGVIGAAGASNGAYHGLNRTAGPEITYGPLDIKIDDAFSYYKDMGKQHNEVIHNNFFHGKDIADYYTPLLDDEQVKVMQMSETAETLNFLQELGKGYSDKGFDISFLTSSLVNKKLMTDIGRNIFIAFFEKFNKCCSPKNMENLINLGISEVAASDLDEKEKQSLIASFVVASQSPFYQTVDGSK